MNQYEIGLGLPGDIVVYSPPGTPIIATINDRTITCQVDYNIFNINWARSEKEKRMSHCR